MSNIDKRAMRDSAESIIGILENIAGFEPSDIDGDSVEIRFEIEGGFDTGCDVSIVGQCQKAADVVRALLDDLEFLDKRNAELNSRLERWATDRAQSASELESAEKRIDELSRHLQSAHAFIEHTEAFGHEASNGILCCGDAQWNIDESKSAMAAAGKGE